MKIISSLLFVSVFFTACLVEEPVQSESGGGDTLVAAESASSTAPTVEVAPLRPVEAAPLPTAEPVEFSVVVYNLENVFDVDGVAMFDDYQQDEADDPFTYTRRKFLTKLENAATVLETLEAGGPDVILFQEFEGDFTPERTVGDFGAFLDEHEETTAARMLTDGWSEDYRSIPSYAWLLKVMHDRGLRGYNVAVAPNKPLESGIAHVNATFSRFPIREVNYHEIPQARDIIEARIEVGGHAVWLYNNHWKSGASNPEREPIRVENARALHRLVQARLAADPMADVIIGGDLNSHYNHSILFPTIQTGINDVLGSHYLEGERLYNLWYEIAPEDRYTEVWRGKRGTLMHFILAPGLYDDRGVSYIDGSFRVGIFEGLNANALRRPLDWSFAGSTGGGASDHFPLLARFRTGGFEAESPLNRVNDALEYEMRHDADPTIFPENLPNAASLNQYTAGRSGELVGRVYAARVTVLRVSPLILELDGREWPAYAPAPAASEQMIEGAKLDLIVSFGHWRGEAQLVVEAVR